MSTIPGQVLRLIEMFHNDTDHYRSDTNNETLCRQLLYQLYALTPDEIRVVEEATAK